MIPRPSLANSLTIRRERDDHYVLNAKLTELTDVPAPCIGVDKAGPCKPDPYRY